MLLEKSDDSGKKHSFATGQKIRVISGVFIGNMGKITSIDRSFDQAPAYHIDLNGLPVILAENEIVPEFEGN